MYSFLSPHQVASNPGRDRAVDETQAREIRKLHDEQGVSYRELARRFNCHRSTICNICLGRSCYSYLGARSPRPQPKKFDEQEILLIKHLYIREDLLPLEIARRVGRSRQSILNLIRIYDW